MSSFKNKIFSRNGNLSAILGVTIGSAALFALVSQIMHTKSISVAKRLKDTRYTISVASGVESMLMAYRLAELSYLKDVQNCVIANPFLQALKEGHGCSNGTLPDTAKIITLFKESPCPATSPLCSGRNDSAGIALWNYGAGCVIRHTSAATDADRCLVNGAPLTVVTLGSAGNETQKLSADSESFEFLLTNIDLPKGISEWIEIAKDPTGKVTKHAFAIRSTLSNSAHVEANGRVTQENPDALNFCQGSIWGTYLVLTNKKCIPFVELGSGTGLAYSEGRFFGFRPFDGQVIDMLAASEGSDSYLVPESGILPPLKRPDCISTGTNCDQIFPAYSKDLLINVDDITVIGDQIYYVAHSGDAAHIGYLKTKDYPGGAARTPATYERIKICDLGGKGWAQAYAGIAALSWSDSIEGAGDFTSRLARFFLKTDSGDLLTVLVENTNDTIGALDSTTKIPDGMTCFVAKDSNIQQIEYKRTFGFDRTSNAKPYFVY